MRTFLTLTAAVAVSLAARAEEPPPPPASLDLAAVLDLGDFYVKPIGAEKDPKTGFVVGGKNDSALVKGLKEINGRTIADLEKDMRPGAKTEVGAEKGFLGPEEKLVDVLVADNQLVVEELGLTHQRLAKHLHAMGAIGFWQEKHKRGGTEFIYQGRRFKVVVVMWKGYQLSPFMDGTRTAADATVQNLDNGKKLGYSLLVPHMIERYGFYEGKGTPYRVDPRQVIEVLDFLKAKADKR